MDATLTIVLPVFGLIGIGYLIGRTRLFPEDGVKALMNFVFYLAIPCLLFRTIGRVERPDEIDPGILFAYYGAAAVLYGGAMLLSRRVFGHRLAEQAVFAMACVYGNAVMVGIPLVYTAYGERGLVPLMLIIAIHPIVGVSLPTVLVEAARGRERAGGGRARLVTGPLLGLLRNPIVMSMVAGLAWNAGGLEMPQFLDRILELLARAATPCALVALGASLIRFRIAGDLKQVATVLAIKLVAFPALVWVAATYLFALDPLWAGIATIVAAMPTGANVFVLAQHYDVFLARAAAAVVTSTAIAWITAAVLIGYFA